MNLGDLDVHLVNRKSAPLLLDALSSGANNTTDNRPRIQRVLTSERPITPLNVRLEADRSPSFTSTISSAETASAETVVRWQPPSRNRSPQRSEDTLRPDTYRQSVDANERSYTSSAPLVVRFDEEQIRSNEAQSSKREGKMEALSLQTSPPTPVDDTPYIRFAIDQLTRDQELQRPATAASSDSYPVERIIADDGLGYMSAEREREAMRLVRKHRSSPGEGRLFAFNATRPLSISSMPPPADHFLARQTSDPEVFMPVRMARGTYRYPDLTYVPTILRTLSMITLSCLCLLMIAALMFCTIYSSRHHGLAEWLTGIYDGRYFLFSFLPQILAACIFLYVQCIMSASTRVMPYTLMAMDDVENRKDAMFLGVFPRTMLWPTWDGPLSVNVANLLYWLTIFTIPLQSSLFSVEQVDGRWRWVIVQGVAWTLVALYILVLIATVIVWVFFFRRTTGLMWDPRSLADVIALLPRSNCLRDFPGTEIMRNVKDIRHKLRLRSDRLGYWRTPNKNQGIFYCVGEAGASTRQYTLQAGRLHEKSSVSAEGDVEKAELYNSNTRFRHIPWFLRDTFVILWAVAGLIFLLALIIVSFLPSTAIRKGFSAQVPVLPNSTGFTPANFLYSFVPSVIGMLLYLFLQPLDMALRKLQPWAELAGPVGTTAEHSLLLDYPACLPVECSLKAFRNRHYRIAFISLLSPLFLLIPVLAGGVFFPLTTPSREVRMIPNLPSFYIILTLLILYLIALLLLIPSRYEMHLPHGVDCLAEIFSFVYGSQMLDDAAFRAPRSKADLVSRLMAEKVRGDQNRFAFGVYQGRAGGECLGIERLGRRGAQEVVIL